MFQDLHDLGLSLLGGLTLFSLDRLTHHDSNVVRLLIVSEQYRLLDHAIHLDIHHPTTDTQRILNLDPVDSPSTPVSDLKLSPPTRHARIDLQTILLKLESQY